MLFIGLKDNDGQNFNIDGVVRSKWKNERMNESKIRTYFTGCMLKFEILLMTNNENAYIVSQRLVLRAIRTVVNDSNDSIIKMLRITQSIK